MIRSTRLSEFKEEKYVRVKSVLLDDEYVKDLTYKQLTNLRCLYSYDFYDSIKCLTNEVKVMQTRKGVHNFDRLLKREELLKIQLHNIVFLTRKIIIISANELEVKNNIRKENADAAKKKKNKEKDES